MMLPINGLKRAMNSPWVVMINPTDEGATLKPSLIRLSTGAIMLPAIIVRVAEARITPRERFFELLIINYLSIQTGLKNSADLSAKKIRTNRYGVPISFKPYH